jgi:YD repeat-containing protein
MATRRALIVTVAGTSTRFRETGGTKLKCLHHEGEVADAIIYFHLYAALIFGFDAVRIVGGYQFESLEAIFQEDDIYRLASQLNVRCVYNPDFATKGSGYSLYLGLRDLLDGEGGGTWDEIVFMEGDLVLDLPALGQVVEEPGDVLTACREPIRADKSVALYKNGDGEMRFAYDPDHRRIAIAEPVREIHNSGQVWKFADLPRLAAVVAGLTPEELAGSNLAIVGKYFADQKDPAVVTFNEWVNCNTLPDYTQARALLRREVAAWKS